MSKAIIWMAYGDRYIGEAITSAQSTKKHNPEIERILFSYDFPTDILSEPSVFNKIFSLPERQSDLWFLDCTRYLNFAIAKLATYDKILLLDTDTYICDDLSDFFEILDRFDIVGTHAPGRATAETVYNVPAAFPDLHIGAIAFNNNEIIKKLFDNWLELYQENANLYLNNDQAPLRDALWNYQGVSVYAMPPEYCFRFPFGGFLRGKVKVLHGRSNQMSYEQIEQVVNQNWRKMRTFQRGMFR